MTLGPRHRKASLKGWWKCLPLLCPLFAVLFAETWMQTRILAHQYKVNDLSQSVRALEEELDTLRDEQRKLTRLDRMEATAPDLGLLIPDPGQVEIITARKEENTRDEPYAVAHHDRGGKRGASSLSPLQTMDDESNKRAGMTIGQDPR